MSAAYTCHAIPAETGVKCGHYNATGGLPTQCGPACEKCGRTKHASDSRQRRETEKSGGGLTAPPLS